MPVVAFDCDYGPREIIEDGISGILVPSGSIQNLARAIIRLARDPELRSKLISNGKQRVESRFSLNRIGEDWLSFIQRVISNSRY